MNEWLRRRTAHIPVSAWSAQSQNALNACDFARALQLARKAVNYADRWLPASDLIGVNARRVLADAYSNLDHIAEARSALAPTLDELDEIARLDLEMAVGLLHDHSRLLEKSGAIGDAQRAILRALRLAETAQGGHDQMLASALARQGNAEEISGRYEVAESCYRRALGLLTQDDSDTQTNRMRILLDLAHLLQTMGRFYEAATLLNPLVEFASSRLRRPRSAPSHRGTVLETTYVLNSVGQLFESMGDLDQAESQYTTAYQASRSLLGEEHLDTAIDLHNLARIALARGDFRRTLSLLQQVYAIRRRVLGERHRVVAATQSSLGVAFYQLADYTQAERYLLAALASQRPVPGQQDADVVATLENLTVLYETTGAYPQAEQYGEEALSAVRALHGDHHPDIATALNNLALVRESLGKYEDAQQLLEQALRLRRSFYSDEHPYVAQSLNNYAALLSARGEYERANELYSEALALKRRLLPSAHASLAVGLSNLAAVSVAQGRVDQALALLREAQQIQDVMLSVIFSLASERQRLAYLAHARGEFHLTLSLLLSHIPVRPELAIEAFDLVLRRKGLSAEILLAQRQAVASARNPAFANQWVAIASLRARIAETLLLDTSLNPASPSSAQVAAWISEREEREAALASSIPDVDLTRRLTTTDHEQVAAALPEETALIEYVKFRPYDFAAVPERGQPRWGLARYAAFVIQSGRPERVAAVDLGLAAPIESALEAYFSTLVGDTLATHDRSGATEQPAPEGENPGAALRSELNSTTRYLRPAAPPLLASSDTAATGETVRALIFDPLRNALGNVRRMFIASDGALSVVPFDVLPLEHGRALIDVYDFSYLDVGRDIVRITEPSHLSAHEPIVLADPDFNLEGERMEATENMSGRLGFPPLPGTRLEGEEIARRLGVAPLLGDRALKSTLMTAPAPRILHIATHGFFLAQLHQAERLPVGEVAPTFVRAKDPSDDPSALQLSLARSGLALAGANCWLNQRQSASGVGNGLLTAEDVAGMDLEGTELVVLSACETGLGMVRAGDGVFGLRRAFVAAGARTLVLSLWRVPDAQTCQLMGDFYRFLLAGAARADALHEAQRLLRIQYPHPYYWGAFVCLGDARPLSGMTPEPFSE